MLLKLFLGNYISIILNVLLIFSEMKDLCFGCRALKCQKLKALFLQRGMYVCVLLTYICMYVCMYAHSLTHA